MNRQFRPPHRTAMGIAVALAGVAVAGWAIADTAGMTHPQRPDRFAGLVLAAGPGPAEGLSPSPPGPRRAPDAAAGPGGPLGVAAPRPMPPPPSPLPPPARLAEMLSAAETFIGIRTEQLDAWRDFTDASLSLLPEPPAARPEPGTADPFARSSELANRMVAQGKKAERLLAAVQRLKAKLSPDQLQRVAKLEAMLPPPPAPPFPPGPKQDAAPPSRAPNAPGLPN